MTNHHLSIPRHFAFWGVILLMLVVGIVQARLLSQAYQQAEFAEARYTHAIAGSRQALWAWTVPPDRESWDGSEFWAGPNFYSVLRTADNPWAPTIQNFFEQIHPNDRERVWVAMDQAVRTDGDFNIDYQVRTGDGDYIWVAAHGGTGIIDGRLMLAGSFTNIDDQMTERLRADMILNSAQIALIMCGPDRRITVYNDAAEEMFGWTREEMLGNSIDRVVDREYLKVHTVVFTAATQRLRDTEGDIITGKSGVPGMARTKDGDKLDIMLDLRGIKYRGKIEFIAAITLAGPQPPTPAQFQPLREPDTIQKAQNKPPAKQSPAKE